MGGSRLPGVMLKRSVKSWAVQTGKLVTEELRARRLGETACSVQNRAEEVVLQVCN